MTLTKHIVEARTWPECTNILVIDCQKAFLLAEYPISAHEKKSLFNPKEDYRNRAREALQILENDQAYLQEYYHSSKKINLRLDTGGRDRLKDLLAEYDLNLEQLSLKNIKQCQNVLEAMPLGKLFSLLVDWHDVIERHYPLGASYEDPYSWIKRANPDDCYQFHYLSQGLRTCKNLSPADHYNAQAIFQEMIDVPLARFSWGLFLRWIYFHRTEFTQVERFSLQALEEIKSY